MLLYNTKRKINRLLTQTVDIEKHLDKKIFQFAIIDKNGSIRKNYYNLDSDYCDESPITFNQIIYTQ